MAASRSTTFDVCATDELRQPILNSIRRYRAGCRQLFAVLLLAQTVGAEIIEADESLRVNPDGEAAKKILEAAMGKAGKAFGYEMREYFRAELYPDSMSFVWDSARRDVTTAWLAKDPEFTRASRGWLSLNGARGITQFNWRGIGFPAATARPKLDRHGLTLKWDHTIGEVQFQLPRLDGGRYWVWHNLRDAADGWGMGTLWLNERDGKLRVTISHDRPELEKSVDPARVCTLKIDQERPPQLFSLEGTDCQDVISGEEAIAWLKRMKARKEALERQRAACGSPRKPWGFRKGWHDAQAVLSRLTAARDAGVKDRNHAWTRRLVSRCVSWGCGTIRTELPSGELCGEPWQWSQFKAFLRYKCEERGVVLACE